MKMDGPVSLALQDLDPALPVENAREHERILKEIETTDTAFVGASLRAIYEGSYHEVFMKKLDSRIKQHDRDIERLCNFHYQGFIESITELIKVRGDAEALKNQVISVNAQQQESGLCLCRKSEDLIQCRLQQRNIASAIDELTVCLPVLQTYGKMQDQLNARRYYSALKTLEKLESMYFPTVHKYRYCEIMMDNVSKIREQVREVSFCELKSFLEVVRVKSSTIGKLAMSQVSTEKSGTNFASAAFGSNNPVDLERSRVFVIAENKHKRKPEVQTRTNPFDGEFEKDPLHEYEVSSGNGVAEHGNMKMEINPKRTVMSDAMDSCPRREHLCHIDGAQEPTGDVNKLPPTLETSPTYKESPSDDTIHVPPLPPRRKRKKGKVAKHEEKQILISAASDNASTSNTSTVDLLKPPTIVFEPMKETICPNLLNISKTESISNFCSEVSHNDLSMPDLIDFSPVYKCLHIFGILKYHRQFEQYYRTQRRKQALITCQPPNNMHEKIESYILYFHQIVGFFIIEDYILHTANDLIDETYISNLWNMALSEIISALRTDSDYCDNAYTLMMIKNLIVLFADTLKAYGFSVDQLFSFLIEMREQYGEILLKKWASILQKIFDEDNYTPMEVASEMEAVDLFSFPFEELGIDIHYQYPKVLPFSRFVPCVLREIKEFIHACVQYCEDLHLSSTEVDDMIRKSVNLLLTRILSTELQKLVQKPKLGLTELVQITINISYLEKVCNYVEEYVCSVTGVCTSASHSAKLVGVSTFKDARSETESHIYQKVNSKIDEFFELSDYNWDVTEAKGTASSYLLDLIAYLKHNFNVFAHLPENVAQTACMSACKHIGAKLMEMLLSSDVKQITMAALQQYNLDVMQCELFANSEPVPGFQGGALQMSFLEIRQLLDLFLSWDWSSYLADYRSGNSKYLRVAPATALSLLERIKENSKRWNILTSFNSQEREKKRLLETVLKQLRTIMNEGSGM